MDEDLVAKNFKEFLDGLSPVTTMAQRAISPPTPLNSPIYTNEELMYILAPSPLPPQQPCQNRLYKKVQEPRKDGDSISAGSQRGYSARHEVFKIQENLKRSTSENIRLTSIVERLKTHQEKETKMVKVCENPKRPEKISEKRKSVENSPRKTCDDEKKTNDEALKTKKNKQRRRRRKMEMTVEEIKERKQLKIIRKKKLQLIAETQKKQISRTDTSQNNSHNNNKENPEKKATQSINKQLVVVIETKKISCSETSQNKEKATQEKCQSHIAKEKAMQEKCQSHIAKDKGTPEKKSDKSKHRRPSQEKHANKIDDRKRKSQDGDEKTESKRRKSHDKSPVKFLVQTIAPPEPVKASTVTIKEGDEKTESKRRKSHDKSPVKLPVQTIAAPEPVKAPTVTIKEEIVDLTEESNSMCVNLKFPTVNTQQCLLETCEELPAIRYETIIKQEVEDRLSTATIAVAAMGTQTVEFSRAFSLTNFALTLAAFVRDFNLLNKTFGKLKVQLIGELEDNVGTEVLIEELREFSRHFQKRFSKIGDKLCEKLAKVRVQNFDFHSMLGCVSSHLAQATPSILLTEHQIWQHLATMLKSCCTESPSTTFVQFLTEALKPPEVFESPEIQFYKKEIGWGENSSFSFDSDTHEVPRLQLSIR